MEGVSVLSKFKIASSINRIRLCPTDENVILVWTMCHGKKIDRLSSTYSYQLSQLSRQTFSTQETVSCEKSSEGMAQTGCSNGDNRWSLKGMTALVTGGTRGIGHAVVEELTGLGARIHTCSRTETELNEYLRDWEGKGFEVTGSVCDVSSRAQREKLMETVSSKFNGKLNILINNAGTGKPGRTVEFTAEEFSSIMAVNFEFVYHLCQLAHPLLKASGAGSIVLMSSVAGVVSLKYLSAYGATKGALNQLAKSLACEWAQDNIRANSIAPWFIKTSLVEP
eukprot:XP_019076089.1 PREDICTED: tropinone reductase homolog At2g29290-like isoform X3 [Vitis vinifera]